MLQSRVQLAVAAVLLLVVLQVAGTTTVNAYDGNVVKGVGTSDGLILVVDIDGKVVGVHPTDFYIMFEYNKIYEDNLANVTANLTVKSCNGGWTSIPSKVFYAPEVDGVFIVESPSMEVSCYANSSERYEGPTKKVLGITTVRLYAKAKVSVVKLGVRNVRTIPIGRYILDYVLYGQMPLAWYIVTVEKNVNGTPYYDYYHEYLTLNISTVEVEVYVIEVWMNKIKLKEYRERGKFESGGVILTPVYDIEICSTLSGSYKGTIELLVILSDRELKLSTSSSRVTCKNISDVLLTPGANQTLVMSVRTGFFSLILRYERVNVNGLVVSIGSPYVRITSSGSTWTCLLQSFITINGFYDPFPQVSVQAWATGDIFGSIDCTVPTLTGEGVYSVDCEKSVTGEFNWTDIKNASFRFTIVYTDEKGRAWTYSSEVKALVTDPSSIAGQMSMVYNMSLNTILLGVVACTTLLIVSIIKELYTGTPLIDPYIIRGTLLTLTVAYAVMALGLPMTYQVFWKLVENTPLLNRYLTPPSLADPATMFRQMISYYDTLFARIMLDFEKEFVGSIGKIMTWLQLMTAFAIVMIAIALALSTIFTPGAGIPFSSIASGIMSLVFGIISILMMQAQMGVFVVIAVTIARVMIFVATALLLSLMVLGTFLICIPAPFTQRIGEDLFGAGLLFMIAFPLIAPLSYAIYMHVMDTVRMGGVLEALGNVCVFIPFPICFAGLVPHLTRMIAFVVASGVVILLVLGGLGYILSKTGVAVGIGEALSSLVWRG